MIQDIGYNKGIDLLYDVDIRTVEFATRHRGFKQG